MSAPAIDAAQLVQSAAATAADIDAGTLTPRDHLAALGEARLLDTDVPTSGALIRDLAGECMSTAFSLWAHRMTVEYFQRGERSPLSDEVFADLTAGRRAGSTAMASGLKWLAGVGEVSATATPDGDGWRLNGFIPWASNLFDDAIVVLPAIHQEQAFVAWVFASELEIRPVSGLLALNGTASGNIRVADVRIGPERVLSQDLRSFARGFRPTFLLLQTAFCIGLTERSLAESAAALDRPDNGVFAVELSTLTDAAAVHRERWRALLQDPADDVATYLRLRLEAAQLAGDATRLESTLAGGRGYQATSGSSRRFREAAFLPVQSPSEGQLRWELASLA
ncbi:MAG: acyl-CoA dehydrogenase family protein [Propionibacteriaceae bacterium]|nr:acyl-CoA dehydrogenase family protein [Propionibacteriaceae bacterium]